MMTQNVNQKYSEWAVVGIPKKQNNIRYTLDKALVKWLIIFQIIYIFLPQLSCVHGIYFEKKIEIC